MRAFLQRGAIILAIGFSFLFLAAIPAARADVTTCRACMTTCHRDHPSNTAETCFNTCRTDSRLPCQGISQADASVGFGSAASGATPRSSRVRRTNPTPATTPAPTEGTQNCVEVAVAANRLTADEARSIVGRSGRESREWACQRVCTDVQRQACIRGGCPDSRDTAVLCCPPAGGIAIGERCGARGAESPAAGGGSGGAANSTESESGSGSGGASSGGVFSLPACIDTGNCQISDIFQTGLNLVRFLFGLAGVLLLVVFVYAGIEYLLADTVAGFSVKTAKERLGKAVTGILIMFFGYTLVKFLVSIFTQ